MHTLGLLMLDTRFPRPLGDIGHPGSLSFPVLRRVVRGAKPAAVVRGDALALQPFIDAGRALVDEGCCAISTSCGFLARWQRELQAALPVPVWASSLMQLAGRPAGRCGVITIEAASLSAAHFSAVGADLNTPVEGITAGSKLHQTLLQDLPQLDSVEAQQQVLAAAQRLLRRQPQINTLVLECTNLPPYSAVLRVATGVRVLDVLTLLESRMAALQTPP
jgi:hypothetical protein